MRDSDEQGWRRLAAIEADAVAAGYIVPVDEQKEERRRWRACDLASLIEGCFHRRIDPRDLDDPRAQAWIERFRGMFVISDLDRWDDPIEPERRYWLVDGQRRLGTIKLGVSRFRGPWLFVQSLYVWPNERQRGVAGRCLEAFASIASRHELVGLRLATYWTWQKSLRFYLDREFWVRLWKHDIQLVREPRLLGRRVTFEGDVARFDLVDADRTRRLWTATRHGDRLVLEETSRDEDDFDLRHLARGTFAMLLALSGWPLVRSDEHWARRHRGSDAGEPEGLAYKIGVFEQVARDRGWVVDTVDIPGLERWQTHQG